MSVSSSLLGDLHGGSTELRFFSAMQSPVWRPPFWYIDCRRATPEEDQAGVDAFVTIDAGIIPVQIKSSLAGMEKDRAHYGDQHCIVVIHENLSDQQIRSKATDFFYRWRGRLIRASRGRARR